MDQELFSPKNKYNLTNIVIDYANYGEYAASPQGIYTCLGSAFAFQSHHSFELLCRTSTSPLSN